MRPILDTPVTLPFWQDAPRIRITAQLILYGGALGIATLLVSLLARAAQESYPNPAVHMPFTPSLFLSFAGAIIGILLSGLFVVWLVRSTEKARNPLFWAAIGLAYGVTLPFFTGMLIPMSTAFMNLAIGISTLGGFFGEAGDAIFRALSFGFTNGVFGLFTGLLGGFLFAIGAWIIDLTIASSNRYISQYLSSVIAVTLSIGVVLFAAYGPPKFLANLG